MINLFYYKIFIFFTKIFYELYLLKRVARRKEDPIRYKEKLGRYSIKLNTINNIWIHCVSIGELKSAVIFAKKLSREFTDRVIVITTSTYSSGKIFEDLFNEPNIVHQYAPIDDKQIISKFIETFSIKTAFRLDSEIWPNTFEVLKAKKIKNIILNARISNKSLRRWKKYPKFINYLLSMVDVIYTQSENYKEIFEKFGAKDVRYFGNIKYANITHNFDEVTVNYFKNYIKNRTCISLISTHPSDYDVIFKNYKQNIVDKHNVYTILCPRHIETLDIIINSLEKNGLTYSVRSKNDKIEDCDVYIADTFGEVSNWLEISSISYIGGGLSEDVCGQSPLEACASGNCIIQGSITSNFPEVTDYLNKNGAHIVVNDNNEWICALEKLLVDENLQKMYRKRAIFVTSEGMEIVNNTFFDIKKYIISIDEDEE